MIQRNKQLRFVNVTCRVNFRRHKIWTIDLLADVFLTPNHSLQFGLDPYSILAFYYTYIKLEKARCLSYNSQFIHKFILSIVLNNILIWIIWRRNIHMKLPILSLLVFHKIFPWYKIWALSTVLEYKFRLCLSSTFDNFLLLLCYANFMLISICILWTHVSIAQCFLISYNII